MELTTLAINCGPNIFTIILARAIHVADILVGIDYMTPNSNVGATSITALCDEGRFRFSLCKYSPAFCNQASLALLALH